MADRPTLYILDAYSLIYRVFHAIPTMTGPAGRPTNAVFGIFRDLLNILRVRKPDYLAVAFEGRGGQAAPSCSPSTRRTARPCPRTLRPQD